MNADNLSLLSSFSSSDDDDETMMLLYLHNERKKQREKRRWWVHNILQGRKQYGEYYRLVQELELDEERFKSYFRLTKNQFSFILDLIGPHIQKINTTWRESIPPRERLAICLRYLATGDSFKSLAFSYRMGASAVASIIPEVCSVLWEYLSPLYLKAPRNQRDWEIISDDFKQWNFPNCIGAIDGKHVQIQAPPKSGSRYFNYKGIFSIVLMALVDAKCRFIYVDVGSYGRNSDGGIFANSSLGKALLQGKMNLPNDKVLPGAVGEEPMPYVIVGDEAFPLNTWLMRPYPGRNITEDKRIFNYRLSRARRIVENAFGILAARWRIYHRKLQMHPENVDKVVLATCVLHNYLHKSSATTLPEETSDVEECQGLTDLPGVGHRASDNAYLVREKFKDYFTSDAGAIPWQYTVIRRGTDQK